MITAKAILVVGGLICICIGFLMKQMATYDVAPESKNNGILNDIEANLPKL